MKKQFLLLLSIAAISSLAACDINKNPSSSFDPAGSSSESSSSDSSSSSSSSSTPEEDIGPVPSEIIIPEGTEQNFPGSAAYSSNLLLNYHSISLTVGNEFNNSIKLRGLPRPLQPADNLSFRSLDSSIAAVDEDGNVTAVAVGQTSIEVADKGHPDVKTLVPVSVFGNLVPAIPEVEGEHYTEEEAAAYNEEHGLNEGDEGYVTTDDWKVEPIPEVPNDKAQIVKITDKLTTLYNGEHFTKEEIDEAQEGDDAYGKTVDDWKIESEANTLKEIVDHELREMSTYKNGKRQYYHVWDEHLVASIDEAYFRITETDGDTKTEDGAMSFEDSEWIFNTNKYYDTYVFHTIHGTKNYFPVSTISYMPKDPNVNNRATPLYEILDNLFTIGRDIFTDTVQDATLKDLFEAEKGMAIVNYPNVETNCVGGFIDENKNPTSTSDFFFDCTIEFPNETADQDDETQSGVPYGTPMPATQRMIYTVRDNKLVNFRLELVQNYSFGGDDYKKVYYIDHAYERLTDENRGSYMVVPDVKDYNLVDYLFAI